MEEQPKKIVLAYTKLELMAFAFMWGAGVEFGRILLLKLLT